MVLRILEHIATDAGVSLKCGSSFVVVLDHLRDDLIGTGKRGRIRNLLSS